ncbi:MAG: hypothetical protein ABSF53_25750 [Terracidiphilus sp.]|jgi:hypothetical protein
MDTIIRASPDTSAYAKDSPVFQKGSNCQVDVLQPELLATDNQALTGVIASAQGAEADSKLAILEKEDAGFEFVIVTNEYSR